MQPIWLLDIDGVINASPRHQTHVWPEEAWLDASAYGNGRWWKIVAAQPVLRFIRHVHEYSWAQIVWLTTWQDEAQNVAETLGLPRLRVIRSPMERDTRYASTNWWKLTAALQEVAVGRPMIWTDDDINAEVTDLFQTYHKYNSITPASLLIAPNGDEGLGPWHLKRIATYLGLDYEKAVA